MFFFLVVQSISTNNTKTCCHCRINHEEELKGSHKQKEKISTLEKRIGKLSNQGETFENKLNTYKTATNFIL